MGKGGYYMKQINFDNQYLIMEHVKHSTYNVPSKYTKTQVDILKKLIKRKRITKPFFEFLISGLYDVTDWRTLDYEQMYQLIYVIVHWDN